MSESDDSQGGLDPEAASRKIGGDVWIGAAAIVASIAIGSYMTWQHTRNPGRDAAAASSVAEPSGTAPAPEPAPPDDHAAAPVVPPSGPPIKVGLLHSLIGPLSELERPMMQVEMMAIDEINEEGGLLGRPLQAVSADGRSDEETFAREARRLIEEEKVAVLIGCLTSASRKRVKDVCEEKGVLLFYPMTFEGLEESPNVVYVGGGPNQQLLPMVRWGVGWSEPPRRRFFLLGAETVYSRAGQELFRGELLRRGLEPVGVKSLPLGRDSHMDEVVAEIRKSGAEMVLDTLDPQADAAFFRALGRLGVTSEQLPVVSTCLGEGLLRTLDPALAAGHYAPVNYYEGLDNPQNEEFLRRYRSRQPLAPVSSAMETAYLAVQFWTLAVQKAGGLELDAVRDAVRGQEVDSPEGRVRIDPEHLYGMRTLRIGRMREDGQLEIVFTSESLMAADPFPPPHDRRGWQSFLEGLRVCWKGRWSGVEPPEDGRGGPH